MRGKWSLRRESNPLNKFCRLGPNQSATETNNVTIFLKWCRLLVTLQLSQRFKLEYNFYTKAAWCPWQNSNLQNHRVLNSGALPICIQGHNNSNLFSSSED